MPQQQWLAGLDPEIFLRDYWQKKPLLIRQAFPGFEPPLDINELAGLALEEAVESRIVMEQGPDAPWQLFNGPFEESFFETLPEKNWTLLVQAVDHLLPEVAELLQAFNFLPRWRMDDIMISYAPPGGSVGPHIDYYDVFLLQASGQRRWQLGQFCDESTPLRQDTRLKILTDFHANPEHDWVMEPGDLLYLPPQLAHWGVSLTEDCTTWSVGFRAPSAEEALSGIADFIGERLKEDQRYADPDLTRPDHPAAIDDAALARLKNLLLTTLDNPEALSEWFGRAMTQTKYADQLIPPDNSWTAESLQALIRYSSPCQPLLLVAEGSRLAFRQAPEGRWLFADGEAWCYSNALQPWIETLCRESLFTTGFIQQTLQQPETTALLLNLVNQGSLYLADEISDSDQALH